MSMQSKCRMQNAECRIGENSDSGIRDKGLGRRGLRLLGRNREIRQIRESGSEVTARPLPQPLSIGRRGWPQAGKVTARQEPRPTGLGRRSAIPVGALHYQLKFLTVRNLISPTAASTYDYVSVNSLQCGNRGHGAASPQPLSSEWRGGQQAGRDHGSAGASPYRLGAAPTTPHWISCSPVSLPI